MIRPIVFLAALVATPLVAQTGDYRCTFSSASLSCTSLTPVPGGTPVTPKPGEGTTTPKPSEGGTTPRPGEGTTTPKPGGTTPKPSEGGTTPKPGEGGTTPKPTPTVPTKGGEGGTKPTPTPTTPTPTPTTPTPTTPTPRPTQLGTSSKLPDGSQRAFPTAEGFGAAAKGGRGGQAIHVTTLADSGPGSLRACIDATGPRNCIIRVSGYIDLASGLVIRNPYITIAGQTAPGQGITLTNAGGAGSKDPSLRVLTNNVIIRHIRVRPGGPHHTVASNTDGIIVGGTDGDERNPNVRDIVIDHFSSSWSTDEGVDTSGGDKITLQYGMVYHGLRPHSKGPNIRVCGVSLINTLVAANTIRNPNTTCGKEIPGSIRSLGSIHGEVETRNNVIYAGADSFNDIFNGRGELWTNIAGNVFKDSPFSKSPYPVDARDFTSPYDDQACAPGVTAGKCANWVPAGTSDPQHICLQSNWVIGRPWGTRPAPIHGVLDPRDAHLVKSTDCVNNPVVDPSAPRGLTGPINASQDITWNRVINGAGALPWARDPLDNGIVANVVNGTGSIPVCTQSGNRCAGLVYPALASGTPYADADVDGMDDAWEARTGLRDPNADADADGYTNLEEFLNELARDQ